MMKTSVKLCNYFASVDRKLASKFPQGWFVFKVKINGRIVELRFSTSEQREIGKKSLLAMETEDTGDVDAVFYYWQDGAADYLPNGVENKTAVIRSRDETGYLQITTGSHLDGYNLLNRSFYFCRHSNPEIEYMLASHTMASSFFHWARVSEMLMLHSAVVGENGKGVMIAARGGSGKSTLAVSCMLAGMDFVSDDYSLYTSSGELKAMPIYSMIAVRPDMLEKLQRPDMATLLIDKSNMNKRRLDISKYPIRDKIEIKAIVYPVITGYDEAKLVKTEAGPVLIKLIHSTVKQLSISRDTEYIKTVIDRLSYIPAYELRMSSNLDRNVAVLRKFIKEEL